MARVGCVECGAADWLCRVGWQASEKKAALKELAVGTNPEHPTTRCFFAVQEDGSKIDFSYIKCIGAIPDSEAASPSAKKAKAE